jgi:glycosyltransferase involved in cell wall biosynthesis
MATVLHLLPHGGGGAETYLDLLDDLTGYEQRRLTLSAGRTPAALARSLPARVPALASAVRNADIVHAHGDMAAVLSLPALAARPAVWTSHGLHFLRRAEGPVRAGFRGGVRAAIAATARTLCTSAAERDELAPLAGTHRERLAVVRNGIELPPATGDAERAAARAALGLADEDVAALFVGELESRKAPLVAVAAAEAAHAGGAPVVLLVAGEGPQAGEVQARASAAVRPLGYRDDIGRLLAAADVFVLPSEREGLSFAVLEAMGRGLAMVVSDGPGNPEAVGDAGIVVRAGDAAGFTAALSGLARDPARRAQLGAAARERIRTELTAGQLRDGVAAAYAHALGAGAAGRRPT